MLLAVALLAAAMLSLRAAGAAAGPMPNDLRAAVVRVEASIDPISVGPDLAAEFLARQPWSPYEAELARRLRIGSTGGGFFVNSQGDLVTNAHVVLSGVRYRGLYFAYSEWDSMTRLLEVVRDLWVTVGEGEEERSYLAAPVAIAEDLDLAILHVSRPPGDDTHFTFLPIGDSDRVAVGDPVSAVKLTIDASGASSPDTPGTGITSGEILSLIRGSGVRDPLNIVRGTDPQTGDEIVRVSGSSPGPIMRLQHNAPVGHGSSGCPVLDQSGRVIGVTYALVSEKRPATDEDPMLAGLNLAIASNVLRRVLSAHSIPFEQTAPNRSAGACLLPAALPVAAIPPSAKPQAAQGRHDYGARQALVHACRDSGDDAGAYYHAAWLAWLATRQYADSEAGVAFLRDRANRDRAARSGDEPLTAVLAAVEAQQLLYDTCLNGAIAQHAGRLRKDIAALLASAEQSESRARRDDPVARLALVHLALALDDAIVFEDASSGAGSPDPATPSAQHHQRLAVLRAAASRAEAASAWLPGAPGPHRTLAVIRARLAEQDNRAEVWELAVAEAQRAWDLDPGDSDLTYLLWTLHLRSGRMRDARLWEGRFRAVSDPCLAEHTSLRAKALADDRKAR